MFSSLPRFLRRFRPRKKRHQTSSPTSWEAEGVHAPALTLLPKLRTLPAIDAPAIINLALQKASSLKSFQSSAATNIPQEIFDLILSEVPEYERKSTLRKLSLVCLAWAVRCQPPPPTGSPHSPSPIIVLALSDSPVMASPSVVSSTNTHTPSRFTQVTAIWPRRMRPTTWVILVVALATAVQVSRRSWMS